MVKCLITRPNHDKVTEYLFAWSREIIESKDLEDVSFFDLQGEDANKKKVESYLSKQSPEVVLFNGHGSPAEVFGFKDEVLIKSNVNDYLLRGKIVYALSCSSASVLGQNSVQRGAKVFIGYKRSFILGTDKTREATPLKDSIARSFLQPSNRLSISLLRGNTAEESAKKSIEEYKREIAKFASTKAMPGADRIASALLWNLSNQIVIGDKEARI